MVFGLQVLRFLAFCCRVQGLGFRFQVSSFGDAQHKDPVQPKGGVLGSGFSLQEGVCGEEGGVLRCVEGAGSTRGGGEGRSWWW